MSPTVNLFRAPSAGRRAVRSGFTVLEMAVTMSVLMVALYALTSTVWRLHDLSRANKERRVAEDALRSMCEAIHSISAAARAEPASWARTLTNAFGPEGRPGERFDVPELTPRDGMESVGSVWIVTDETVSDKDIGFELGLPRDLDGDGAATNTDVSQTATVLPVVLRLRWKSAASEREIVHAFLEPSF